MMKVLSLFVFLIGCLLPGQWLEPAKSLDPMDMPLALHVQVNQDLSVLALHDNGLVSLSAIASDGSFAVSFTGDGATKFVTQGPIGGEPVPMLRTSWCDGNGVTHEVATPIISQTEAGVARAIALHNKLVVMQQTAHPPKPCPPS